MIKALLLIFGSEAAWERIVAARRRFLFILLGYLFPLLLLTSAVEGYGLMRWGKPRSETGRIQYLSSSQAVTYETIQFVLTLVVVFVGAIIIKSVGETFRGRHSFTQVFTVAAYGLSPLLMLRMLNAFQGVSPWLCWAVGIILSVAILYRGLPLVMQPDPPHAMGLYFTSAFVLILITGLSCYLTTYYSTDGIAHLDSRVSDIITHRFSTR
jgi:hypothetical protein